MSLKERTINVDIMTKEYTKLKYKQGDSNQTLKFKFYKNGSELDLTGYVAGIFYEKPNNEVLEKGATINNNIVTTTITSGVLNTEGIVKAEIFLTKNTEVAISFTILINVEKSIDASSALEEREEWDAIRDLLINGNNFSMIDDDLTATSKTWSSDKINSQIKEKTNNLQGQINNLVIDGTGDSNPEVVQARGEYDILNDRLNSHEDSIEATKSSLNICKEEISKLNEKIGYDTKTIYLEKNSTYIVPSNVESQTVELSWDGDVAEGDSLYFLNGANGPALPYTLNTGYNQISKIFGTDVVTHAFNNKGSDMYGKAYGCVYINVGSGDTITAQDGYYYDINGNKVSSIVESGIYYIYVSSISSADPATNGINRGYLKSENGTSVIEKIALQSLPWLSEQHTSISIKSITDFRKYFPADKIVGLGFGESYTPIKQASILIDNTTTVTGETLSLQIHANMSIVCTLGSVTFNYKVLKSSSESGSSGGDVTTRPWADYKWACIGDSYTDTTINATYKYENIIHDLTGIQVQMLGVGGTGWWKGYDTQTSYRFRAVQVESDTDIVTLFGSINDWKYRFADTPLTIGTKSDSLANNDNTLCAYINDVFDALEETVPTAQIIVFSPMYYHGLAGKVQELFDAVKVCTENRGYEYVDMLNIGWKRIEKNDTYAQKYCTDYSTTAEAFGHPNNLAHKTFIAPKFYNKLKEYLPIHKGL